MNELEISVEGLHSKNLSQYLGKLLPHYVIVVCDSANEKCPRIFPGMRERLVWQFDDPPAFKGTDDEVRDKFREVRDAILLKIREWLESFPKR